MKLLTIKVEVPDSFVAPADNVRYRLFRQGNEWIMDGTIGNVTAEYGELECEHGEPLGCYRCVR